MAYAFDQRFCALNTSTNWQPRTKREMKFRYLQALLAIACIATSPANAQQGCAMDALGNVVCAAAGGGAAVDALGQVVIGKGGCANDSLGQVICSQTQYGGAAVNALGQVQTGRGQCVRDGLGQVMCSSLPGGGAAVNALGQAVCAGGCVSGH